MEYDTTPTTKQKKFVKNLLENAGTSKAVAIASGYGKGVAKSPKRILQSKGVKKLFLQAGISPESVAVEYNKLNKLPVKEKEILVRDKLNLLKQLKETLIDNTDKKLSDTYQFIDKFLNIQSLGQNRPKMSGQQKRND